MTHKKRFAAFAVLGLVALTGGMSPRHWLGADTERAVAELRGMTLPDPDGRAQTLDHWKGDVLVVNFWATWCEPCREEVPALYGRSESGGLKECKWSALASIQPSKYDNLR